MYTLLFSTVFRPWRFMGVYRRQTLRAQQTARPQRPWRRPWKEIQCLKLKLHRNTDLSLILGQKTQTDSGCRGLMRENWNYDKITEALWCFGVATQRFYCVLFFVSAYYNKFGMFCFSPYPVLVKLKVIQHYSKVSAIHIFNNKNIKRVVLIFMPSK